ncbi:6-phosphogluconolactonase [Jannaschia aquimarina]|uniref:6-phosphogluconolactonase n=1 Tax=Jannaschia aquimarina TaxID=935700 RepID=A0A0D1CJB0_9RHOB|nr:6-phosphogluconolactonase [Jannaschia aquimarina]KIT14792.1 6-phosphogluconolactonase [Jannaschia aquimarina]SNS85371.1 6-phosphogluconolactonase [Jannaschia aquimarina]
MDLIEYPDREILAMGLADMLAGALRKCLTVHERASFCVPGGSSPGEVFASLSGAALDWDRVDVLLNDERWVPETSDRSNTALLRRTLLTDRAAAANLVPMTTDAAAPEDGIPDLLPRYDALFPISLLLLGMGEDGHTASLFPGGDKLSAAMADDAPALMAMRAPGAGEARVTLTLPVLRDAMETHLLIMGDAKREVLDRARNADPMDMPIAALLPEATVHWAP